MKMNLMNNKLIKNVLFYTDKNCPYYCGMTYSEIQKKSFYHFSFNDDDEYFILL